MCVFMDFNFTEILIMLQFLEIQFFYYAFLTFEFRLLFFVGFRVVQLIYLTLILSEAIVVFNNKFKNLLLW